MGGVKQIRNEIRSLLVHLEERCVMAKADTVVESKLPANLPLILRVPLKKPDLQIGKRTSGRFLIISEAADQCI